MSHFVETMAYAGDVPWHSLGTHVGDENVDSSRMQEAAGLQWKVKKAPLSDPSGEEIPGVYGIQRTDTGRCFAGVSVGERYEPFQNEELFAFGDSLRTASGGELKWHTAGSLKHGRRVWALAQMAGSINVERRAGAMDVSAPFLLLTNSHDGSSGILVMHTAVRVVCWNTLSYALSDADNIQRVRHTSGARDRLDEAAQTLGYAVSYFERYADLAQGLADKPMSHKEFGTFASMILTGVDDPEKALRAVANAEKRSKTLIERDGAQLYNNFVSGRGNAGRDCFDALNSITEFVDHQRGRMGRYKRTTERLEQSLDSAAFGQGQRIKQRAVKLLTRW